MKPARRLNLWCFSLWHGQKRGSRMAVSGGRRWIPASRPAGLSAQKAFVPVRRHHHRNDARVRAWIVVHSTTAKNHHTVNMCAHDCECHFFDSNEYRVPGVFIIITLSYIASLDGLGGRSACRAEPVLLVPMQERAGLSFCLRECLDMRESEREREREKAGGVVPERPHRPPTGASAAQSPAVPRTWSEPGSRSSCNAS